MQNSFPNGPPPPLGYPPLLPSGPPGLLPSPYGQPPVNMFYPPPTNHHGLMLGPPPGSISQLPVPPTVAPIQPPKTFGEWVEYKTPDGKPYYFNMSTKQTVWTKPEEMIKDTKQPLGACPWNEYRTLDGKVYYFNSLTQTSSWTVPPEMEEMKARLATETTKQSSIGTTSVEAMIVQDVEDPKKRNLKPTTPNDLDETSNQSDSIPLPPSLAKNHSNNSKASGSPPEPEMTRDELFAMFKEILREKNISSTSSWENALKYLTNEPRFERFRTHPERKQFFNSYKVQRVKEEKEELKAKIKKAKETLDTFLRGNERMNSILSYRRACEIFRDHDAWKIIPDDERRDIFDNVSKDISRKEREAIKAKRKRNTEVLAGILNSMLSITSRTTWQEAQHLLVDNITFASDQELLSMDKEDALTTFEEHIRQLENDEEEERQREEKMKRRNERLNRESFIELLDELHRVGKLNSLSKWKNLFPEISADSRFEMMLNQPTSGSNPLDLFKFYVEDLKARYEDEKLLIKDILKENKDFVMGPNTTYAEFVEILSKDLRSAKLDCGNVKLMYEKLLAREQEKHKEQQREILKKKKKLESAFIDLLNTLEPPVTEHSKWEDVRPLLVDKPAFEAIETEKEREQMFLAAINSMMEACQHNHGPRVKPKAWKNDKKRSYRSPSCSRSSSSRSRSVSRSRSDSINQRSRSPSLAGSSVSSVSGSSRSTEKKNFRSRSNKKYKKDRYRDEGELVEEEGEEGEIRAHRSSRAYDSSKYRGSDYRKSRRSTSRSPVPSRYHRDERRSRKSPISPSTDRNGSSSNRYHHHHRRADTHKSSKHRHKSPSSPSESSRNKEDASLAELQMQKQMVLKELSKKS